MKYSESENDVMVQIESARLMLEWLVPPISDATKAQIITRIPELFEADVVAQLPPYFHAVDSEPQAVLWLERMLTHSELYVIRPKHCHELMGFLFVSPNSNGEVHIGYLLGKAYWRKGFAFEFLQRFIAYAKTRRDWRILMGGVERTNTASSRLLTKLGFTSQQSSEVMVFYRLSLG